MGKGRKMWDYAMQIRYAHRGNVRCGVEKDEVMRGVRGGGDDGRGGVSEE